MAGCNKGGRYATGGAVLGKVDLRLKNVGDDSKPHWVCNSENNIVVGGGYASHRNGDNATLQNWGVLIL